jgi:hypothetical protein
MYHVRGYASPKFKYAVHTKNGAMLSWGYETYEAARAVADKMHKDYKAARKAIKAETKSGN